MYSVLFKLHIFLTCSRVTKNTDGNFVKINLKKKSHVKGFALRGAALRKQVPKTKNKSKTCIYLLHMRK